MIDTTNIYNANAWELFNRSYNLSQELEKFIDYSIIHTSVSSYIDEEDGSYKIKIQFFIDFDTIKIYLPDIILTELSMFDSDYVYYCALLSTKPIIKENLTITIVKWILEKI